MSPSTDAMNAELARLGEFRLPEIRARYFQLTSATLPKHVRTGLARLILAHALQQRGLGGVDRSTAKELDRLVATIVPHGAPPARKLPTRLRPGTRLVRQWHGRVYEVTVTATGFECDDRYYRSLTEIARDITGTNWNGWTFFGVKRPAKTTAVSIDG